MEYRRAGAEEEIEGGPRPDGGVRRGGQRWGTRKHKVGELQYPWGGKKLGSGGRGGGLSHVS